MNFLLRQYRYFRNLSFVRDIVTMQSGTAVYMIATFASSIVFARLLGIDGYGLYAVVLAFVGTVAVFLNFGQGTSLLIFLAEEHGKKNMRGKAAVIRNFLQISALNSLVLLLFAFLSPWLTHLLYSNAGIGQLASILFVYQALDIGNSFTLIVLQSLRRIRHKVLLEQAANMSFLGLAIISLFMGYGIRGILFSQLIVSIVFLCGSAYVLLTLMREKQLPRVREILAVPVRDTWTYLRQGVLFSVEKNIGNLFPNGLFFALSLFASPAIVGIAKIAVQLSSVPRSLILAPVGDLSTVVLAKQRSEGIAKLRRNAAKIIKHTVALQAAITFALAILIIPIIRYLYGIEYLDAIPLTLILLLLSLATGLCITNSPLLRLFRKTHISIMQAIVSWVIMLLVLFVSAPYLHPFWGFAIAYGIGQLMPLSMTAYLFTSVLKK